MRVVVLDVVLAAVSVLAVVFNAISAVINIPLIPEDPMFRSLLATLQIGLVFWMARAARQAGCSLFDRWLARQMNVRVVHDGQEIPARLYRIGEHEGQMEWAIVDPPVHLGDKIKVDMLPAHTTLIWTGMDDEE